MKRARFVLAVAVLAVAALTLIAPAQDRIIKKDGSVLPKAGGREIKVVKETFSDVEYQMQGLPPLKLPASDVERIIYHRMPEDYRQGVQSMEEGYYDDAIRDLRNAIEKGSGYPWIEQNALYRIALCHLMHGQNADAVKTFRELLTQVPTTRFLPQAYNGIIQGTFQDKGKEAEAQIMKTIGSFEASIKKHRLDKSWAYVPRYWMLRLKDAKGEDISAQAEKLSQDAATENPAIANKAKILIGFNLLQTDPVKAKRFFETVRSKAGEKDFGIRAGAYAGLGLCIYKSGSEDDPSTFKKAREYLLRAVVLADKYPDQVEREVAVQALFHAGRCFFILRKSGPLNSRYARDIYREIIDNYPGSEWARKADEEIKKL